MAYHPTRKLTILALDPSVRTDGKILRAQIEVPNEALEPGPRGYRVFIVDYDSSADAFRSPGQTFREPGDSYRSPDDPFEHMGDRALLASPDFHAFMTYGIVMKTLARFESALGRRLSWSFGSHQIQVSPHAFADANASTRTGRRDCSSAISRATTASAPSIPACRTRSSLMRRPTRCWMGCGSATPTHPRPNRPDSTRGLRTSSRCCRSFRHSPLSRRWSIWECPSPVATPSGVRASLSRR